MISKDNVQVFGNVPKDVKRRIKRITRRKREWSESKLVRAGLLKILKELEDEKGPTHDGPSRNKLSA